MMNNNRYIRQADLIGSTGQARLGQANLLIIGAGGLGTLVSSFLAAAGVGRITLVDHDVIDLTNLSRQLSYTENNCGELKVEVLKNYLGKLNSACQITAINAEFKADNADELIKSHDIIIDCSDNFATKYLLGDICNLYAKPLITASINEFVGQVLVIFPEMCYRCVFPEAGDFNSCLTNNVIGPAVGIVASHQAHEAFKLITGFNNFSNLIQIDSLNNISKEYKIVADRDCINNHNDYPYAYESKAMFKPWSEIFKLHQAGKVKLIKIDNKYLFKLDRETLTANHSYEQPLAIVCDYGYRSKLAALKLAGMGYRIVYYTKYYG